MPLAGHTWGSPSRWGVDSSPGLTALGEAINQSPDRSLVRVLTPLDDVGELLARCWHRGVAAAENVVWCAAGAIWVG